MTASLQLPLVNWPPWFKPSKYAKTCARNVARGIHPLGAPLGPEGKTCGDCRYAVKRSAGNKSFWKCAKREGGEAFDLRKKWRACIAFKRRLPVHWDRCVLVCRTTGEPEGLSERGTIPWDKAPHQEWVPVDSPHGEVLLDMLLERGWKPPEAKP